MSGKEVKKRYKATPIPLETELLNRSREPFQEYLRAALLNGPSPKAIADLAERSPQLWVDYIGKLASLYGYTQTSTINHNHRVVSQMSDADLQAEIAALDQKQLAQTNPIDVPFTPVEDSSNSPDPI